jgi:hypothetical protein
MAKPSFAMTNNEKTQYLNSVLEFHALASKGCKESDTGFFSCLPKALFKYRSFDKYSFDLIAKGYLYLSPASALDDPFECMTDFKMDKYFDTEHDTISASCFKMIVETVLQFAEETKRERLRQKLYSCMKPDYTIDGSKALQFLMDDDPSLNSSEIVPILNNSIGLTDSFQSKETQQVVNRILDVAHESRNVIGICSLSETKSSQPMWAAYAKNYTGYCVEYDFEHAIEAAVDTYPVIYEKNRDSDVFKAVVSMFLNQMVKTMSNGAANTDESQLIRMFLTKNPEWAYQKEWRVLGDAGQHVKAPKIKAVYVGSRASKSNYDKMKKAGRKIGFDVYMVLDDAKNGKLAFKKQQQK